MKTQLKLKKPLVKLAKTNPNFGLFVYIYIYRI